MKIITLLPAASEIICQLGLSDNLKGVSHECDYPKVVMDKIRVTSSIIPKSTNQKEIDLIVKRAIEKNIPLFEIDNEKILEINPDLIITQGLCEVCSISKNKIEAKFNQTPCTLNNKTKIISLNGKTFEEICQDVLKIGKIVDKEGAAKKLISEAVSKSYNISDKKVNKNILLLEWIDPYFSPGHWIPEQIEMAGFFSSIGKKGEKSREISNEELSYLNPDYIGLICCGYNFEENKLFAQKLYNDDKIKHLEAIKKEQVFAFDSNAYFSRPSLRIIEGAIQINEALMQNNDKFRCKKFYSG
jgi:iron complex transport system substrate-binding protein